MTEVKIQLIKVIGSKTPFYQSGTCRITLPKQLIRKYYGLSRNQPITEECMSDENPFVFIETNKGILLMPLKDLIKDNEMMKGLYFAPVYGLSLKEISGLIDESVEKDES